MSNPGLKLPYRNESIYSFIFPFEAEFDALETQKWMQKQWCLSFYVCAAYLAAVLCGKHLMKNRTPLNIRGVLFIWNLCLATFSVMGACRTMPELYFTIRVFGWHSSFCNNSFYTENKISAYWSYVFVLSKIVELLDTFFVVARKQKITFIHVYHHASTLVICWYNFPNAPSIGRYVVSLNYFVHAIMYPYYALRSLRIFVPRWIALCITTLQILQMAIGCVGGVYVTTTLLNNGQCAVSFSIALGVVFFYSILFGLFLNFFIRTYVKTIKSSGKDL